jgi:hypothetical protein
LNGKNYTPPGPHEDAKGEQFCPVALRIFMKTVVGKQEGDDTTNHGDIEYVIWPAEAGGAA